MTFICKSISLYEGILEPNKSHLNLYQTVIHFLLWVMIALTESLQNPYMIRIRIFLTLLESVYFLHHSMNLYSPYFIESDWSGSIQSSVVLCLSMTHFHFNILYVPLLPFPPPSLSSLFPLTTRCPKGKWKSVPDLI